MAPTSSTCAATSAWCSRSPTRSRCPSATTCCSGRACTAGCRRRTRSASSRRACAGPRIPLMDEPCSALDPIATAKIEDLIQELKRDLTVVIVTHNMQQAARVSDFTGFFYLGELVEFGATKQVFESPRDKRTE